MKKILKKAKTGKKNFISEKYAYSLTNTNMIKHHPIRLTKTTNHYNSILQGAK